MLRLDNISMPLSWDMTTLTEAVLRKLRSSAATRRLPVIMLTAKNTEYDRVEGIDAGADDFSQNRKNNSSFGQTVEDTG